MDLATTRQLLLGFGGLDGTTRLPDGTSGTLDAQLWCINMARRRLCRRPRHSFNYQNAQWTVNPGDVSEKLSDSVVALQSVHYPDGSGGVVFLNQVPSLKQFQAVYPTGTVPGTLAEYAIQGRNVLLGPPPAGALTLSYDYWGLLPDLATAGPTTDDFLTHCYELIVFEALAEFVPIFTFEDTRQAVWSATRDELLEDFLSEQADLATSDNPPYMEIPG